MRPLTEAERRKSVAAKQAANAVIRPQRRRLAAEIEKFGEVYGYDWQLRKQAQLERLQLVTGLPVEVMSFEGDIVILDYEKLRCLTRRLKYKDWTKQFFLTQGALVCRYQHRWDPGRNGFFELYELPAYQRELLHDLPMVPLAELGGGNL